MKGRRAQTAGPAAAPGHRSHLHPHWPRAAHRSHLHPQAQWGFCTIRSPLSACRRRVAPLMVQFPRVLSGHEGASRPNSRPCRRPRAPQPPSPPLASRRAPQPPSPPGAMGVLRLFACKGVGGVGVGRGAGGGVGGVPVLPPVGPSCAWRGAAVSGSVGQFRVCSCMLGHCTRSVGNAPLLFGCTAT